MYTAYSKALPDSNFSQAALDGGKANTQAARQAIAGTLSSLVSSRTALTASITASKVAGGATESSGTLATANASVKQAQGAYDAALSRLEKTIIRSPINGTLNSLTINTGDFIGAFTQVAVVSNNGALEIVAFVNEDDAKRVVVGAQATINDSVAGVVTRVASAIDPTTKKIEVRVGIKDTNAGLINGKSVSVKITKSKKDVSTTTRANSGPIVIPLSALKLTPRGANVFTVSATDTLIAIPVKEGAILGEQIQILEGLTGTESIVVDARGLKEGQVVDLSTTK
jgi:RND family efflux transporter MFP subunit